MSNRHTYEIDTLKGYLRNQNYGRKNKVSLINDKRLINIPVLENYSIMD